LLFHCNNGCTNAPRCYVNTCVAYLVFIYFNLQYIGNAVVKHVILRSKYWKAILCILFMSYTQIYFTWWWPVTLHLVVSAVIYITVVSRRLMHLPTFGVTTRRTVKTLKLVSILFLTMKRQNLPSSRISVA
jgi:hypothetical protein